MGVAEPGQQPESVAHAWWSPAGWLPAPVHRSSFRRVWIGMGVSYAGDRLQGLAQAWLVATLTHSALGVSLITALNALPLLLLPLGGVIAEEVDRRRLVLVGQL